MAIELRFGTHVALTDAVAGLAGLHLADDSPATSYLVLRRLGWLGGLGALGADAIRLDRGELSSERTWNEATALDEDGHGHDPRLILDSTKIRFVGPGALTQREGEIIGVISSAQVEAFLASVGGATLVVPIEQVDFQSRRWIYVDAVRYPLTSFRSPSK